MLFLIKKLVTGYFCLPLCFIIFLVSPLILPHLLLSDSTSLSFLPPVLSSFHHLMSYATTEISDYLNRSTSPHFTTKEGIIPQIFSWLIVHQPILSVSPTRHLLSPIPFLFSSLSYLSSLLKLLFIFYYLYITYIFYLSHASHYCYPLIYYSLLLLPLFYIFYSLL